MTKKTVRKDDGKTDSEKDLLPPKREQQRPHQSGEKPSDGKSFQSY